MFNVAVGIIWQTCLTVIPVYIIIRENVPMLTAIAILIVTTLILKKNWYDKLGEEDEEWKKTSKKESDELVEAPTA
jgi:hypothetical protein